MPKTPTLSTPPLQRALRRDAAARYIGVSTRSLSRLYSQGLIKAKRIGRTIVFITDDLDSFLDSAPDAKASDVYSPSR